MQIVEEIESYLDRLRKDYDLSVTLHPAEGEYLITNSKLINYNFHTSEYCTYIKSYPDMLRVCIAKQERIKEKLAHTSAFCGVCHAGVRERVYRLSLGEHYLGFISVSGYRASQEEAHARIKRLCRTYDCREDEALRFYGQLREEMPSESLLDSLLFPLCRMIEYGNLQFEPIIRRGGNLYIRLIHYINDHFCEDISLSSLSERFSVSVSQISHTFKKNSGKSISEYITERRIELGKNLLQNTDRSITDIAYTCGFSESSYFCNVFRRLVGVSPHRYRKSGVN